MVKHGGTSKFWGAPEGATSKDVGKDINTLDHLEKVAVVCAVLSWILIVTAPFAVLFGLKAWGVADRLGIRPNVWTYLAIAFGTVVTVTLVFALGAGIGEHI